MDKRTLAWKRKLDSEYNRRCYVFLANRYSWRAKVLDWLTLVLSAGVVGSLATQYSWLSLSLAIATALCAATSRAFNWSEKTGQYTAQSELWSDQKFRWEDIYNRLSAREAVPEVEIALLDAQFLIVFKQYPYPKPSPKRAAQIQAAVIRLNPGRQAAQVA